MPFRFMSNASSTFMNEVFIYFIGKFVIVYLDDIMIFSHTEEEHLEHLRCVLKKLQMENLLVNVKKFSFPIRVGVFGFFYLKIWFEDGPRKGASNH